MSTEKPRSGQFYEKDGSYKMAIRVSSAVVDRGGLLHIEVYFCGYGEIESAKFIVYPALDVFDVNASYIYSDLKRHSNGKTYWGGKETLIGAVGKTVCFPNKTPYFFDINDNKEAARQLITETQQKNPEGDTFAPIQLKLQVKKNVRPGSYSIQLLFNYYNGSLWDTSGESVNFTVRNIYQRYEGSVWILGIIVSFFTIWESIRDFLPTALVILYVIFIFACLRLLIVDWKPFLENLKSKFSNK